MFAKVLVLSRQFHVHNSHHSTQYVQQTSQKKKSDQVEAPVKLPTASSLSEWGEHGRQTQFKHQEVKVLAK